MSAMPDKGPRYQIGIHLSPEDGERFERAMRTERRTKGDLGRVIILDYLDTRERRPQLSLVERPKAPPQSIEELALPHEVRPPSTEWEPIPKLRKKSALPAGRSNVDLPRPAQMSALPVVAYVAAGRGRGPAPVETGEEAWFLNPIVRQAKRHKWQVIKVVGDSMEPAFSEGDMVLIEPGDSNVHNGDAAYVWYDGEPLLKVLEFERDAKTRRYKNVTLKSVNEAYDPITVREDGDFKVLGVQISSGGGKKNFATLRRDQ